jgi:MFS family permease
MLVVGAAMFGMFYFITFFVQGVREYGPLKTGVAFLPVAFVIGIVSQINARLMPRLGPKPLMIAGTSLLTIALFWFASVNKDSSYAGKLLPGMIVLAVAMGCLFVPLTVTAVSDVANTDAGLASALLNVGQQVGGALGLSVMTTVFGTAAKNWSTDHIKGLIAQVPDKSQLQAVVGFLQAHGQNAEPKDIQAFVQAHPSTSSFFASGGPFNTFVRELLAYASGKGFLLGAALGVIAIISAVVLINVKKSDVPEDAQAAAMVA